jgi:hypothetical protein
MIVTALTNQAKLDMMDGVHQPGDTYRLALYTESAELDENTVKYVSKNEVKGAGYERGGYFLTGRRSALVDGVACLTFNDVRAERCSFEEAAAGAIIYNQSRNGAVIATFEFDALKKPSNGLFELEFPLPTPNSAVIVIA